MLNSNYSNINVNMVESVASHVCRSKNCRTEEFLLVCALVCLYMCVYASVCMALRLTMCVCVHIYGAILEYGIARSINFGCWMKHLLKWTKWLYACMLCDYCRVAVGACVICQKVFFGFVHILHHTNLLSKKIGALLYLLIILRTKIFHN